MAKQKILVIDDHPAVGELMEAVLKLRGYEVLCAAGGVEGVTMARSTLPGLIFLDIMMPEMDGFRVCEALKADPATRGIPVVFLTARGETPAMERAADVGAQGYVKKPFKSQEILAAIKRFLGGP